MSPPAWHDLVWGGLSSLALLAVTSWFVRGDRGGLDVVGAGLDRWSAVRLLGGAVAGAAIFIVIFVLVSLYAGPLTLVKATHPPPFGSILLMVGTFLGLSAMEELGFRGYPLRTLSPVAGFWPAQLLVALAFGISHLLYGWPWQAVLFGVVPSGLLFGVAATSSRGLAFPIGLHAALNLATWVVGSKGTPGLWSVELPGGAAGRVATTATWVGFAVTLVAGLTLFRLWGRLVPPGENAPRPPGREGV